LSYEAYRAWADQPLDRPPELSVVIPAYNEERRILPTIGAVASYCCDHLPAWELVVADDGSTDLTRVLLEHLGFANLRVLSEPNQGKGAAVRRGVLAARGDHVLFTDADLSTPIQQLGRLLAVQRELGAPVVVGSRAVVGAAVHARSLPRRLLSRSAAALSRRSLGLPHADTQCGFKLFTRDAARFLFARQTLPGFAFDLEILYVAHRAGMRVAEVAVEWHDAPGSKVSGVKDAVAGARDIARIRRRARAGRYTDPPPDGTAPTAPTSRLVS
jgi:dolichyl-phosphate beta-glucosyltransferase